MQMVLYPWIARWCARGFMCAELCQAPWTTTIVGLVMVLGEVRCCYI